jgi:hypothetical protein
MDEAHKRLTTKLMAMQRRKMIVIAADTEKRAAWELLHGPTDWGEYADGG